MKSSLCIASLMLSVSVLGADDGIWLLNEFPRAIVKAKYGFDVSDAFLKKLQLGSVRFNNGGSGSFVSADGLVFTNHHVGADCIQKVSSGTQDFMKDGFLAQIRAEEKKCPDLELNVLLKIENVTEKVKAAASSSTLPSESNKLRQAEMSAIEKSCSDRSGHRCDVVTLFSGGQYHLYEYQKFTDIRLVFAPEKAIAFFGGDIDNFTYPRWNLDIAFFRVYENNQPVKPLHFFPWSKSGAKKGELTFVSGNPGSTGRLLTVAELELQRDVILKLALERHRSLIAVLKKYSLRGKEEERVALEELFGSENSFKALSGFLTGLNDPEFMLKKRSQEELLRDSIAKNPDRQKQFGNLWTEIALTAAAYKPLYGKLTVFENLPAQYGSILPIARQVYRYAEEKSKPNGERLREYSEAALASLEESMYSTAPLTPSLEAVIVAEYLRFAQSQLGADHPVLVAILGAKSPEAFAVEAVEKSKLFSVEERRRLSSSIDLVRGSDDGLIRIVRLLDAEARKVRKEFEDKVKSRQASETALLAQAQLGSGGEVYPDATFTLRVSFGPAIGYRTQGGQQIPWTTNFAGLYPHVTGKDPFALPERWLTRKSRLNLKIPFNFVTTADTHGGNSGSPTVNTRGEIIGILFDGNLEGLPNRFLYTDKTARSVHVASQGIAEALKKIYSANSLLKELGLSIEQ